MFECNGFIIQVVRQPVGLRAFLFEDETDANPLHVTTPSRDPYAMAALLVDDLDLRFESEIVAMGELIDAHIL